MGNYENRFLQPLSETVWWCSLAALTICGAVLSLGAYLEGRPRPLSYAVFSITAATCQQGIILSVTSQAKFDGASIY